jgi:membrane protein required for colicin V production
MEITTADWNAADWVILGVVGISTMVSLLRGFTREAMSVVAWVLALMGGRILSPSLSALLAGLIENPVLRELVAFGCLFLVILTISMLLAHVFSEAVRDSPLSATDRLLGMAFGFARGILVVVAAVAFTGEWLASELWWQQSVFIPHLALLEGWTRETAFSIAGWISG